MQAVRLDHMTNRDRLCFPVLGAVVEYRCVPCCSLVRRTTRGNSFDRGLCSGQRELSAVREDTDDNGAGAWFLATRTGGQRASASGPALRRPPRGEVADWGGDDGRWQCMDHRAARGCPAPRLGSRRFSILTAVSTAVVGFVGLPEQELHPCRPVSRQRSLITPSRH